MIDTFESTLKKFSNMKNIFDIKKMEVDLDMAEIYYNIPVVSNKKEEVEQALDATGGWADMHDWKD